MLNNGFNINSQLHQIKFPDPEIWEVLKSHFLPVFCTLLEFWHAKETHQLEHLGAVGEA